MSGSYIPTSSGAEEFGPYVIGPLIGRGGMGEVHRAFDTRRQRQVALKRLPRHLGGDPRFEERFRRESETVARLADPHVVPIHDFGVIDGRPFLDMRLVDGENLATLLAREGPLAPDRAVAVVTQIASALAGAHAAGVVHRDVKPSNVVVTAGGDTDPDVPFCYLVDFGVASTLEAGSYAAAVGAGGSLPYLAPERLAGGPQDGRVDTYSLACVLYEMLTGRRPFPQTDPRLLADAHLRLPPPVASRENPAVPAELDAVVERGMAKRPGERHPGPGDLARAAADALRRRVGRRRRRRIAAVAVTAAVLAGVVTFAIRGPDVFEGTVPVGTAPAGVALAADGGRAYVTNGDSDTVSVVDTASGAVLRSIPVADRPKFVTISPDGSRGYVTALDSRSLSIFDTRTDEFVGVIRLDGSFGYDVAIAPDGNRAFVSQPGKDRVLIVDLRTSATAGTIPVSNAATIALSPDGRELCVSGEDGIVVVDTSRSAVVGTIPGTGGVLTFARDGRTLYAADITSGTVSVNDVPSRQVRAVHRVGAKPNGTAVSPDGELYVTDFDAGTLSTVDARTGRVSDTRPVGPNPVGIIGSVDGRRLYVVSTSGNTLEVLAP